MVRANFHPRAIFTGMHSPLPKLHPSIQTHPSTSPNTKPSHPPPTHPSRHFLGAQAHVGVPDVELCEEGPGGRIQEPLASGRGPLALKPSPSFFGWENKETGERNNKRQAHKQANRPTGQQANRPTGQQANRPTGQGKETGEGKTKRSKDWMDDMIFEWRPACFKAKRSHRL